MEIVEYDGLMALCDIHKNIVLRSFGPGRNIMKPERMPPRPLTVIKPASCHFFVLMVSG